MIDHQANSGMRHTASGTGAVSKDTAWAAAHPLRFGNAAGDAVESAAEPGEERDTERRCQRLERPSAQPQCVGREGSHGGTPVVHEQNVVHERNGEQDARQRLASDEPRSKEQSAPLCRLLHGLAVCVRAYVRAIPRLSPRRTR